MDSPNPQSIQSRIEIPESRITNITETVHYPSFIHYLTMRRRQLLTATGATVAAATALASGVTAAASGRGEVPGNAPSAEVHPFPGGVQQVSAGEWVVHRIGWVDVEGGDSTREDVEEFLAKTDTQAWIDGDPVEDTDAIWGEPVQGDDGQWYVWWRYATPPKQPGTYSFRYRIEFTEDMSEGDNEAGDVVDLTGTYEVSGGRGGRGGQ